MARPKQYKVGNYTYVVKEISLDDLPPDAMIIGPYPDSDFIATVEDPGIIYPIVLTDYQGELYLIDGGRRVKAARRVGYETINANIFHEISPLDRAAWSIILNEQRSINPVAEFLYYSQLKKQENWDEIAKQYRLNKNHMEKVMSLDKLSDKTFISAYQDGKIATGTLFSIAKLGEPRQKYLLSVLETKGKIAASDVKEARKARQTAVLEANSEHFQNMDMLEQVAQAPAKLYVTLQYIDGELVDPVFHDDFHDAYQTKLEGKNIKMFQLVEV